MIRSDFKGRALALKREADSRNYQAGWIFYTLIREFPFLAPTEWHWLAGLLGYSTMWPRYKIEEQRHAEAFGQDRWGRGAATFVEDAFAEYWKKEQERYREAYRKATGRYPEDSTNDERSAAYQAGAEWTWHKEEAKQQDHAKAREEWAKSHTHGHGKGHKAKSETKTKATQRTIDVRENDALKLLKIVKPYTLPEVKAAFRVAAKRWHPDMDKGDADKFRAVNDAYNYLLGKFK